MEILTESGKQDGVNIKFTENEDKSQLKEIGLLSSTYSRSIKAAMTISIENKTTENGKQLLDLQEKLKATQKMKPEDKIKHLMDHPGVRTIREGLAKEYNVSIDQVIVKSLEYGSITVSCIVQHANDRN